MSDTFANVVPDIQNSDVIILNFMEAIQPENKVRINGSIYSYFVDENNLNRECLEAQGRQKFNDRVLKHLGKRYLIGRYLEDRGDMLYGTNAKHQGRMIHMGVDLFCTDLEPVYSPADGEIIGIEFEDGAKAFGHSVTIKHETDGHIWYSFFGHLGSKFPKDIAAGRQVLVERGELIGHIGDHNENGGWSRHLHYQLCTRRPTVLVGYVSRQDVALATIKYPNPYAVLNLAHLMTDAI